MRRELQEELREGIDEHWAEPLRHLPLSEGRPDPERSPSEFIALLRTGDRQEEDVNFSRGRSAKGGVQASGGHLRLDPTAYPDLILRKDDKLVALDRAGEPVFLVQSVDRRSHHRVICDLEDAS